MSELFLEGLAPRVKVHAVVYFSILDHFLRRNEGQKRVIGALLGTQTGLQIEITNCYPVPHNETDGNLEIDPDYHENMLELHQQVNPREVIVGWYATGSEITEHSCMIHDFFANDAPNLIHLCVDTTLKSGNIDATAFMCSQMGVEDATTGKLFTPIECSVEVHESERVALKLMDKTLTQPDGTVSLSSNLDQVSESTDKLQDMIARSISYVEKVVSGEAKGDPRIGRFLRDTVAAVPKIDPAEFKQVFNNTVQDQLMVMYLANLARTQVKLQDKLTHIL